MATDAVVRTATAKEVTVSGQLYGMVGGDLTYAYDMAAVGRPLSRTCLPSSNISGPVSED
jgi:hypothetical protein